MVSDGDQGALFVDIAGRHALPKYTIQAQLRLIKKDLLHGDAECDVGRVLLQVPEADEVLCVHRREVVVELGSLVSEDLDEAGDLLRGGGLDVFL